MTIGLVNHIRFGPINGFVCCTRDSSIAVCNPTTRQIVKLPDVELNGRDMYTRLGYDPVEDQFKVLCVLMFVSRTFNNMEQEHLVCTVRSGQKQKWRKIQTIDGDPYFSVEGEICIDGAIYYAVDVTRIARFDVRSEKIDFIQGPEELNAISCNSKLVNYQGKLAGLSYVPYREPKIRLWILQDAEKQEWSSMTYGGSLLPRDGSLRVGGIHNNEVMMVSMYLNSSKLLYVYYYDINSKSIRRLEVDGIADSEFRRIHGAVGHYPFILCFPGHVENITFL